MLTYKQWLEEATILDISNGTEEFRFNVKEYPQAKFVNINKVVPYVGTKSILFSGEIPSFTRRKAGYNQTMMFKNVNFSDEPVDSPKWRLVPDRDDLWYEKPTLSKNDVALRCGCADDVYRFHYARKQQKALFGNIISYTKKTNRPPINPDNILGMCKHLKNFVSALLEKDYISGE